MTERFDRLAEAQNYPLFIILREKFNAEGDFEKLKFLISSELINPNNIRFFLGYTGWGEGQLEEEMSTGSWVIADADANYLFKMEPTQLWQEIMEKKGSTYTVIAQMPDSANWN